jgi:hypothetical protein
MKRTICSASLIIAAVWTMEARAGGPPPVYMIVDKVIFEPNEDAPKRIQIWGTFSLLQERNSYGAPVRGYLYYAAAPGAEEECRKEWSALKEMTNKKTLISFGCCGEPRVREHLRKPSEKVAAPIPYPHGKGGFALGKNAESNFPSLKNLLRAADLTRIDPGIGKEPRYQSTSPKYCLLVFGPETKTRVWLILDGDTLYVDRNSNGDLTEEDERVQGDGKQFNAGEIANRAGKAKYDHLRLQWLEPPEKQERLCMVSLEVRDKYRQYGCVHFSDRPQDAPVLFFDGPLTMGCADSDKQALNLAAKGSQINAWIETPSPEKQRGGTVFLEHSKGVPCDVHPMATIEFPNQDPKGEPLTITAVLNQRC